MGEFFARRPAGRPGLALFLNAGDPPLDELADVLLMLDERRVDCLELAVPFPDSATDGPVIRRSAQRALANGVGLEDVLEFLGRVRPALSHLRVALFADWSYTIKPRPLAQGIRRVADSGADGLLLHGLPPRLRRDFYQASQDHGLPIVTTCYCSSRPEVMAEAAAHASAYLYLVAHYGRSGTKAVADGAALSAAIATVRTATPGADPVPVAVGFGIRSAADIASVHGLGADAAIVGSAAVSRVECALGERRDVVEELHDFVCALQPVSDSVSEVV